jgi:ribosomal protein S18 acetylase RimI-like enzyme
VSWFRSSRRRRSEREESPPVEKASAASTAALAVAPADELVRLPLADLHALARDNSVPRYRLMRREQLVEALSGEAPRDGASRRPAEPAEAAPANVRVSEATEASVELLDAVQHLVRQLSSSAAVPGSGDLEEVVASPSTRLLVAHNERDEVVGMLTLALFRIPTGLRAWVEDVVVDESARRQGVGEALTQEASRLASESGARTVDLTSRPSREAAIRMYTKLGFERRETNVYRVELG